MTLREELEHALVENGLTQDEAYMVVQRVVEIVDAEEEAEARGQWDTEFKDLVPHGHDKSGYTPEELKTFQDYAFDCLWIVTKEQVKYFLYSRMEALAELIMKFK